MNLEARVGERAKSAGSERKYRHQRDRMGSEGEFTAQTQAVSGTKHITPMNELTPAGDDISPLLGTMPISTVLYRYVQHIHHLENPRPGDSFRIPTNLTPGYLDEVPYYPFGNTVPWKTPQSKKMYRLLPAKHCTSPVACVYHLLGEHLRVLDKLSSPRWSLPGGGGGDILEI